MKKVTLLIINSEHFINRIVHFKNICINLYLTHFLCSLYKLCTKKPNPKRPIANRIYI